MFGGWTPSAIRLADTWEWDGVVLDPDAARCIRRRHGCRRRCVRSKRKRIVMFGGYQLNYGAPAQDTWEYDGVDWTPKPIGTLPATARAPRWPTTRTSALHDVRRHPARTTSGTPARVNETWTYNGTDWAMLNPLTKPPVRAGARMAFDSTNKSS